MADFGKLFLLIEAPVLGELGPGTERGFTTICDECNRRSPFFDRIELALDRWKGHHLFHIYGEEFVSADLHDACAEAGVTGAEFQPVAATTLKRGSAEELPGFYYVKVSASAQGPDNWWELQSTCDACGQQKWFPTKDGLRSANGPSSTGTKKDVVDPLPLRVFRDSWDGSDIFNVQSPSAPVVTERFVEIAREVGVPGVHFRETEFVSGP